MTNEQTRHAPLFGVHQHRERETRSRAYLPGRYIPCSGTPQPLRGPAGYLEIIGMMRGGFPDIQWTLEEMVAEGDKLAGASLCGALTEAPSSESRRQERQSRCRR